MATATKGVITVVSCEQKKPNELSVNCVITCKDEAGSIYQFTAAYFAFELRPFNPDQGMTLSEWVDVRRKFVERSWIFGTEDYEDLKAAYLRGVSADYSKNLTKERKGVDD